MEHPVKVDNWLRIQHPMTFMHLQSIFWPKLNHKNQLKKQTVSPGKWKTEKKRCKRKREKEEGKRNSSIAWIRFWLSRAKTGCEWHPHLSYYVSEPTNLNPNILNIMNKIQWERLKLINESQFNKLLKTQQLLFPKIWKSSSQEHLSSNY